MNGIDLFLVVIYSVTVPLNLFGNILVCLVVRLNRSMKTPMNFLLVNLAIADMVVAIFLLLPILFIHLFDHPTGRSGDYLCKFLNAGNLMWVGGNASGSTLVAIAIERYFAIIFPHSSRLKQTHKKVNWVIFACWMFGIIANLPLFIVTVYDKEKNTCRESWSKDNVPAKIYTVVWFLCGVGAPLLVMSVLYSRIARRLWSRRGNSSGAPQQAILLSRKRVTKILLVVTIAYGVFWLPNPLLYMMVYNPPFYEFGSPAYRITVLLACLGSSFNPFIYSLNSEKFRKHSKEIVCWFRKHRRVSTHGSITERTSVQMKAIKERYKSTTETLGVATSQVRMPFGLL